jgi:hypothetical protein
VACGLVLLAGASAAQTAPQQQPLVQPGNVVYLGSFTLPASDGSGRPNEEGSLTFGGKALGVGPDGQSLYFGCHAWHTRLARVTIPAIGGVASVVTPCTHVDAQLVDPTSSVASGLGGSLVWNGRVVLSAFSYYDADTNAVASHFWGAADLTGVQGPARLSGAAPGLVGGYMGVVPAEWRALLGGPALTGQCCTSIITRSSYGPAVSVFNPDDVGVQNPVPSKLLLGYPSGEPPLGEWAGNNALFNGATKMGGVAFPAGTRSVLFVGRHGDNFCYGDGAACNDPTDGSKGSHAYPYRHQVWAYDANDLLAVKQGAKAPWQVRPYATWTLSGISADGSANITSATYDHATRRLYVVAGVWDRPPEVHVFMVAAAVSPR